MTILCSCAVTPAPPSTGSIFLPALSGGKVSISLCTALDNAKKNAWEDVWGEGLAAAINDRGYRRFTLLHHACWWGNTTSISKLVVDFDADLSAKTSDGKDVFEVVEEGAAARHEGFGAVRELLEKLTREKAYAS